jgi:glycosyltransferase involved in cell wall biosynthesis
VEWGKILGWLLGSRRVLDRAAAVITCNGREAALMREKFPDKIIVVQPHGVPAAEYARDQRAEAQRAFPRLARRQVLLSVGRIDPIKNQDWLARQFAGTMERHPLLRLVMAGPCTDEAYGKLVKKQIRNLGLEDRLTLTGRLPPGDPRLIGLLQSAAVVVVPSQSETFGLVILEAWAAGTPVIAGRTSGALQLICEGENGWLFDLHQSCVRSFCETTTPTR